MFVNILMLLNEIVNFIGTILKFYEKSLPFFQVGSVNFNCFFI